MLIANIFLTNQISMQLTADGLQDGKYQSKSLKALYDDVKGRHHYWQERKAQRLAQYSELQVSPAWVEIRW